MIQALDSSQCISHQVSSESELWELLRRKDEQIDCFIFQLTSTLSSLLDDLKKQYILLPTVVIVRERDGQGQEEQYCGSEQPQEWGHDSKELNLSEGDENSLLNYHPAVAYVEPGQVHDIEEHIHRAIDQFVALPKGTSSSEAEVSREENGNSEFVWQKKRLIEKLRERLGYLGIYYKRNPGNFLRNMSQADQQIFLRKLRQDYRTIILNYFSDDQSINQKIDTYVDAAFFADVSVSQIVEIHMELMDEFSKQLQLEGRGEEILLDYRLTLIDVIAHLCEMYRRSIPRDTVRSGN